MYYQSESCINGVYSRQNLPDNVKDGAYIINLDEYSDLGTHWIFCMQLITMLLIIFIFLELNIFQNKLQYLLMNA